MISAEIALACRRWLPEVIFIVAVGAISIVWIIFNSSGSFFAVCFALCLLLAKFGAFSGRQRYMFGAAALCMVVAGQTLYPLDYFAFPNIAFNVPFVSAYLYPSLWPGALSGMVFCLLLFVAAVNANIPVYVFGGPLVGVFLLPLLCHGIASLLHRLVQERNAYRELSAKLRTEIEQEYLEKEKVKEKLYKLDRLNLIGEMAVSIGHEVRNPLTTTRGYLQYFEGKGGFVQYKDAFRLMIGEIDRANSIITEFLSLAKNKRMDLKLANLKEVLLGIGPMLEVDAIRSGHELEFDLDDTPDIVMDNNEIRQMVINLVQNGLEAMTEPGHMSVKMFMHAGDVLLSVKDSGPGIPPHVMEKLGTPFFTTKDKGIGLGLAVAYRIAERHRASIAFESSPKGTSATISFRLEHP